MRVEAEELPPSIPAAVAVYLTVTGGIETHRRHRRAKAKIYKQGTKIPKLDDWEAVLDPGLQISHRNGDQRRAGAIGEEEVTGRRLEGRVGMVLRRGLEEAETEKDSGEEMEDLRASVAVNGEIEEAHQIFVDLTEPNSKRSHCEPT
ncbi:hypothetical protein SDJN03_24045, partial [Cucurbita argyrosperma subsp. sororia]